VSNRPCTRQRVPESPKGNEAIRPDVATKLPRTCIFTPICFRKIFHFQEGTCVARKICILTSAHPTFDVRIFHKEGKSLARAGYEVILVASGKTDGTFEGVTLKCLPIWKSRADRFLRGGAAVYSLAVQADADVYHFHDPELIPVALLLLIKGKKVVYDIHEDLPRTIGYKNYLPRLLDKPISGIVEVIENWASRRFSALVTASPQIASRFSKRNKNLAIVNNYPMMDEIQLPSINSFKDRKPTLLYVGMRITRSRGAEEMVRAMAFLPEELRADLTLVGNWDNPELAASLETLAGWNRTTYLGLLDRAEVAVELQKAYAGLVILHPEPNYVTSQPVKLYEYMCAGLPVIASDFPVWREIVTKARCGLLVDPMKPQEIAKAMEYLLTHPEEAEEMGRRGFQAIVEHFNWSNEEEELLRFYNKLFSQDAAFEASLMGRGQTA
jgi:glycosyltransferase involved in cell wall biosynthesis